MDEMVVIQGLRKIFNRNTIDEKAAINGIELGVKKGELGLRGGCSLTSY